MTLTVYWKEQAKYGRDHLLVIEDEMVKFDTADEEYGLAIFPLEVLEQAIKEYKQKRDENLPHF